MGVSMYHKTNSWLHLEISNYLVTTLFDTRLLQDHEFARFLPCNNLKLINVIMLHGSIYEI